MSKITTALVGEMIRVYIADTTEMVKEAQRIHQTKEVSIDALGKVLTASSILGKMLKNEQDVLTLKVVGSNRIKTILVTSNFKGNVKGYISDPEISKDDKTINSSNAIGKDGNITLIRDFGLKEPYVGISKLVSGSIDEDLVYYFINSEQQATEMALNNIIENGEIIKSGGIIIQTLPGVSDKEKELVSKISLKIHNVVDLMNTDMSSREILEYYFKELKVSITGEYNTEYKCDCSYERISKALITVGKEELIHMKEFDKGAELTCHFCNTTYKFSENDLGNLIELMDEK